jgi:hypothetical protein
VRWLKESKRKAKFGGGGDLIVSYTILWHQFSRKMERNVSKRYIASILTLSLLMLYISIYGAPSKARNLTSYIYSLDFLLGILLLEPCTSLIYVWKTNKYTNHSFSLLIMYGSSYMFRYYIAIIRERS